MALGSYTAIKNGRDTFGGHLWAGIDYKGSQSYVQGGDGPVDPHAFAFNNTIVTLIGGIDLSGKFQVVPRSLQSNVTTWQLVYISLVTATLGGQSQTAGQEAVAGTNLSTFMVRVSAIGY